MKPEKFTPHAVDILYYVGSDILIAVSMFLLAIFFMSVSCWPHSLTLKIEAIYFSETSLDFQLTTKRYIPEDKTFQHFCYFSYQIKIIQYDVNIYRLEILSLIQLNRQSRKILGSTMKLALSLKKVTSIIIIWM
jgi:hypothetical protein